MDNFNKIISFVLGLIVVIVFLLIITGKLNLRKNSRNLGILTKASPTPTLRVGRYLSPTPATVGNLNSNNNQIGVRPPTSIPATGSPTLLIPVLFSVFSLGFYLKRKK